MSDYIMDLRKVAGHRPLLQVGGSVELDEVVEDAAKRELFEQTGLVALELTLFGVFSGPDTHYVYPNGVEVSNVDIVYLCRKYEGTLKPQKSEVEQLRFFPAHALPEEISPPIRKPLLHWAQLKMA